MTMTETGRQPAPTDESLREDEERMRIGEVARQFGVSLRTLRFYEDKGLIQPERRGSMRLYGRRELGRLKLILFGTRVGFSLREIKQMMDMYDPGGPNTKQYRVALDKASRQIVKLEGRRSELEEAVADLRRTADELRQLLAQRQSASAA